MIDTLFAGGKRLLSIVWAPLILFVVHIARMTFLPTYNEIDMLMHFCGGASIAFMFSILYCQLRHAGLMSQLDPLVFWLLLISLSVTVGVKWEWLEYVVYTYFVHLNFAVDWYTDTLNDLALDTAGAVLTSTVLFLRKQY